MTPRPTVLFDLDETLLDHTKAARAGFDQLLDHLDIGGRSDELWPYWLELEQIWFDRYQDGQVALAQQRRQRMLKTLERAERGSTVEEADALFAIYLAAYETSWTLFDDVAPCLEGLAERGISMGILTNGSEDQQRRKFQATGLDRWMADSAVTTSEGCGFPKPHDEAFRAACSAVGAQPSDAVFVGDNLHKDVLGALGAGLQARWLDRSGQGQADVVRLTNLGDLDEIIGAGW